MAVRLLLDENIEHRVYHRLLDRGYAVDHVDFDERLRKGVGEDALARFSLEREAVIVTYDDDFGQSTTRVTTGASSCSPTTTGPTTRSFES
jgi:predicted nuclease of predicted toxin-antitoxin system